MNTKDYLVEAKNLILNHGWVQGGYGNERQGYCAVGALTQVQNNLVERGVDETEAFAAFMEADSAIEDALRQHGYVTAIPFWNDASGRTREQVLEIFDAAAQAVAGV